MSGDDKTFHWLLGHWSTGLSGSVLPQLIIALYGAAGSGKTSLLETLLGLYGDYAIPLPGEFLLHPRWTRDAEAPSAMLLAIKGKRFAVCPEFPRGRLHEQRLKVLVGDDTVKARAPYARETTDVKGELTLTFSSNSAPSFDASDVGLLRRLRCVQIKKSLQFGDARKRRDRFPRWLLKHEAAGIAALLWRAWQTREDLPERDPKTVRKMTTDVISQNDRTALFLAEEFVHAKKKDKVAEEFVVEKQVERTVLYARYQEFAKANGFHPLSSTVLYAELRDRHGLVEKKSKGKRYFLNVELNKDCF